MHIPGSALIGLVTISAVSLSGAVGAAQASPFHRPATASFSQVVAPQGAAGAPQGVGGDGIDAAPTPQAPAPPVAPAAPVVPVPGALPPAMGRVFAAEAGIILSTVRPDRVMEFEMVLERIHEALSLSTDPVRREQAAGWKAFKQVEPGPNGSVLYVFVMDPAVKGADYTISKVLSEAFPDEVREIFKLYTGSIVSQSLMNLTLMGDFGKPFEAKPVKPGQTVPVVPTPGAIKPAPSTPGTPDSSTSSPSTAKPTTTPSTTTPRGKNDPIVTAPIVIDPDADEPKNDEPKK